MHIPLLFEKSRSGRKGYVLPKLDLPEKDITELIPERFLRGEPASLPELSEGEVVRHFTNLSQLNYHVDKGLYPLGSCTMKYNPKVNETAANIAGFRDAHPLQPETRSQGALQLMHELQELLAAITGFDAVSLQPAAGAQGELTGVLIMKAYLAAAGLSGKHKILIPDSAHGTNPASVAIAGLTPVEVKSNSDGMVDIDDLRKNMDDAVAGMMITNPNTLGIFERNIATIAELVHDAGGLMYLDGANLNAQMGIVQPGRIGFDVMHINLHKTFSTPHGGGGPGSGPVAVSEQLAPFLPVPVVIKEGERYRLDYNRRQSIGKVHSFYGNFGIFVRAFTYIRMNGAKGLRRVSEDAVLNANYLLSRLKGAYKLPFPETPMHEFVLSGDYQKEKGVKTMDIAKRLLDYGFHAPTIYFPLIVHEALMIEPTETETREALDAFADAMLAISREADENPDLVREAPHSTPVKRLNDALAARRLNIVYKEEEREHDG
ncbi:MAG: glycine dehydrogenase subunit 2 [Chlorobi bacterium]|nr:glycine dehydrogenase subunit 2 [Chlorobiota bacterium]